MKHKIVFSLFLWINLYFLNAQDTLKTYALEEVAIHAIRTNENSPTAQVTLDRKGIQKLDYGQNSTLTLEAISPSFQTYSDAGSGFANYNQFRMRGIDQTRINVTLNGVPLNDMVDQGVYFSNFMDFMSSMQSVQIQRGISISSYGTASFIGNISFETLNLGSPDPWAKIALTGGSFKSMRGNAEAATGKMKNNFSAYAKVSKLASEGYKEHSGSRAQSLFFSGAKFFNKGVLKFSVLSGKTQNDQAYLPVLLADIKANPKTNYFNQNDIDDFEQEIIQIQYLGIHTQKWSSNTSFYYNGSRGYFPFTAGDQYIYGINNNHFGSFFNCTYENKKLEINGGVHGYWMKRKNENAIAPNRNQFTYADQTIKKEISTFIKSNYTFSKKFTASLSFQMRYVVSTYISDSLALYTGNKEAKRKDFFINSLLKLQYQVSEPLSFYAAFGRTGREPTRSDLLVDPNNYSFIYSGNASAFTDKNMIKSEYVNDFEWGVQLRQKKYGVKMNAFFLWFENEIAAVGGLVKNSYAPIRKNVKSSIRTGWECSGYATLTKNLEWKGMGTFLYTHIPTFETQTENLKNVKHPFSPQWNLYSSFRYKILPSLFVAVEGRYVSHAFLEISNHASFKLPSYFVANINMDWTVHKNIHLNFRVQNIGNEQYFTDGAPIDLDYDGQAEGPGYRIQPPRHYFVTATFNF